MTDTIHAAPRASPEAAAVARLLRHYPRLDRPQMERLRQAFGALSILDMALLTTDETLRAKLDAFRRDHRPLFRPPASHYLAFLAIPGGLLIAMGWGLWTAAIGG